MSAISGAADRRLEPRASLDVLLNRFIDGYPYLCVARDVSRAGMRLLPLHEPHLRDASANDANLTPKFMGLQFQLPGLPAVLTASGEAVFKDDRHGEIGIRFTRLPQASRDLIDAYLKTYGSDSKNWQNEATDTTST